MKLRNIFIFTLAGLCGSPFAVSAQVTLSDKTSQKVDLGYGVEQSEFLTTAATTTITAEELRRTSAISLADALYGKLLGLNAFQNTGFKGEEGRGAQLDGRVGEHVGEIGGVDGLVLQVIHVFVSDARRHEGVEHAGSLRFSHPIQDQVVSAVDFIRYAQLAGSFQEGFPIRLSIGFVLETPVLHVTHAAELRTANFTTKMERNMVEGEECGAPKTLRVYFIIIIVAKHITFVQGVVLVEQVVILDIVVIREIAF